MLDHSSLDILLVGRGGELEKPWLTIVMDDYSRAVWREHEMVDNELTAILEQIRQGPPAGREYAGLQRQPPWCAPQFPAIHE